MTSAPALHHVQIFYPPGEEAFARRFYAGTLGLRELRRPESLGDRAGLWFETGDGRHVHLSAQDDLALHPRRHFALRVADLESTVTRLRDAGARFEEASEIPGWLRTFVFDPFGNKIELDEISDSAPDVHDPPVMGSAEEPRLVRSRTNRILAGVAGGVAEYLRVDATLVRLLFVVLSFVAGLGAALYLVLLFIMPSEDMPPLARTLADRLETGVERGPLRRSARQRLALGVAGGLAEYLHVDVTLLRVAFLVGAFVGGAGLIAYLVLAALMRPPAA